MRIIATAGEAVAKEDSVNAGFQRAPPAKRRPSSFRCGGEFKFKFHMFVCVQAALNEDIHHSQPPQQTRQGCRHITNV